MKRRYSRVNPAFEISLFDSMMLQGSRHYYSGAIEVIRYPTYYSGVEKLVQTSFSSMLARGNSTLKPQQSPLQKNPSTERHILRLFPSGQVNFAPKGLESGQKTDPSFESIGVQQLLDNPTSDIIAAISTYKIFLTLGCQSVKL